MSFADLAPELIHQIFNTLYSINDVINLSLTNHHFNSLLKHCQKLPTLFSAADREFGPLDDIAQLVTYNASQPVQMKRCPQQSYALLRQMIRIGGVAQKYVEIYPERRWHDNFLERRALTAHEAWRTRRAVYRYWLYCEAFHGRSHSRATRTLPHIVEERAQLLRTWSTSELIDIEDIRLIIEDIVSAELCPTDGAVRRDFNQSCIYTDIYYHRPNAGYSSRSWNSWPPDTFSSVFSTGFAVQNHEEHAVRLHLDLPVSQRRKMFMTGWGDEVSQYYVVESMMKLNPAHVMHLCEQATSKPEIERWLLEHFGEEWFWENGQTWLDTWTLVLFKRGENPSIIREVINDGDAGIATANAAHWSDDDDSCL